MPGRGLQGNEVADSAFGQPQPTPTVRLSKDLYNEADRQIGGGLFFTGGRETGYNMPGSVFDREFRCTFDLFHSIPSTDNPSVSVTDEFFAFNKQNPFNDRAHILDRNGNIVQSPRSAHFTGAQGTGNRIDGCNCGFTFVRQGL
jgi:hypothetical protein